MQGEKLTWVFDRAPFISQYIYGPHMWGRPVLPLDAIKSIIDIFKPEIYYLRPKLSVLLDPERHKQAPGESDESFGMFDLDTKYKIIRDYDNLMINELNPDHVVGNLDEIFKEYCNKEL